jgi:hypothetical protein
MGPAFVMLSTEYGAPIVGADDDAELDFEDVAREAFDGACRAYVAALDAEGGR